MPNKDYEALYNEKCEDIEHLYNLVCELTHKNEELEKSIKQYKAKIQEQELIIFMHDIMES